MAETHLIDVTGRTVFRGTQKPPGGGSSPYVRKTITYADFVAGGGIADLFTVAEGDVLVSLAVQIPVAFDDGGSASGIFFVSDIVHPATLAIDLSSDTTTTPGGPLFAYEAAPGTPGDQPGLPMTGAAGGSPVTVAFAAFGNDGAVGTLIVIAEIVTPTEL